MSVAVVHFVVRGTDAQSVSFDRPYTVVYDGACRVCNRLVTLLRTWDRTNLLTIVPSQATGVRARFPWIPARAYAESVQLIGPGGRTWQGARAIEQLLRVLPHGRWIAWVFHIPGVRRIAEWLYIWFARNRYRLGCGEHCQYRELDLDYGDT